jgi:tetratricopeptide (TPR) repeat protein
LVLGECYLRLMHSTRERVWRVRVPELADLRRAQASYALNRAVALDPDLAQAHFHLGALYSDMGYLDLAAEHRRRYLELIRRGPLPAQVDLKEYLNSLERAERELTQLERRLRDLRDAWANEASGRRVGDRAELAARRGLAGEALRTLLASDVSAFGSQGLRLELRLLLGTGRAVDVIDAMEPDQQAVLGTLSYSWTRAEALAAVGNYDGALEECSRLAQPAGGSPLSGEGERAVIALFVTRAVAEGSPIGKTCPTACLSAQQQAELINRAVAVVNQTRQRADALALRGLLAVEAGRFDVAAESIDRAFTLGMAEGANRDSDWDFRAREIARSVADWLSARSR